MFKTGDIEFDWAVEQLVAAGYIKKREEDLGLTDSGIDYTLDLLNELGGEKRILLFLYHIILLERGHEHE